MHSPSYLKTGTASGTIVIVLANINSADLLKTAVLAAVGAMVSFLVSYIFKRIFEKKNPDAE